MSLEAITWAFRQDIRPSSVKFVLVALSDNASADQEAWPCIQTLEAKTCQNRKTIIKSLDLLEAAGFMTDTGKRRGGTQRVKVYRLNLCSTLSFNAVDNAEARRCTQTSSDARADQNCSTEQYQKRNHSNFGGEIVPNLDGNSTKFGTHNHNEPLNEPNTPQAPQGGDVRGKKSRLPQSDEAKRVCDIFNRRHDTQWSEKEVKAFRKIKPINLDDLALLERYYKANRNLPDNICRKDLGTFLNNFQGEIDRARHWESLTNTTNHAHQPTRQTSPANHNCNRDAVSQFHQADARRRMELQPDREPTGESAA